MIKLTETAGEVSRVLEFDTVAELVEYERLSKSVQYDPLEILGEPTIGRSGNGPETKVKLNDKGYSLPTGYVPFVNSGKLEASVINHKSQGETVIATTGDKYLIEVEQDQLTWREKID